MSAATGWHHGAEQCLRKEFHVMRKLNHPNVLHVVALISSSDDAVMGLLLPLADENLWTWLCGRHARNNHVDGVHGHAHVQLLLQAARGLCYLHVSRVIHLDLKPENMLVSRGCCLGVHTLRIADFGSSRTGPNSQNQGGERVNASVVNTEVYRPLQLFHCAGSLVRAVPAFDRWAFGCIVFDVAQGPERLCSRTGKPLRLFSALPLRDDVTMLRRARNLRLQRYLAARAAALVLHCQPDGAGRTEPRGHADLCRACEQLLLTSP